MVSLFLLHRHNKAISLRHRERSKAICFSGLLRATALAMVEIHRNNDAPTIS
jgi:hypothetical protein